MRLTRTVLPALLVAVLVSGCGGGTTTGPTGEKGKPSGKAATPAPVNVKEVEAAAKAFATEFLTAVKNKQAKPEQLTPEFWKALGDTPAAELTFMASKVAADKVTVTLGPDGSAFAVGTSTTTPRTLLRVVKVGTDWRVDWISVGPNGVPDATLSGSDAPARFAAQALVDAVLWHKHSLAAALLTDSARNAYGQSVFDKKFDPGALKNKLEELLGGYDIYTVTGVSNGIVTVELTGPDGKKTATLKTVKGTRPGDWVVDAIEVK